MKRIILITTIISVFLLSSCNYGSEQKVIPESEPEPEPPSFLTEVTGEDVYENGYYCEEIYSRTTIYFTLISDSEDQAGWYIYLSDNELNDDEIEALQKTEPVLTGNGSVDATYGQWVYIFCDINAETAEEPTKDILSFSYMGDYA